MNITQFEKYVEGCLITWNHGDFTSELLNSTLGLAGEFVEFHQTLLHDRREKQIDEAGDLLYYSTVLLYNITDYSLKDLDVENERTIIENTASAMHEAYLFPDYYPFDISSFNEHDKFYATLKYIGFIVEHVKKYIFHGKSLDVELLSEAPLQILMWLYYILNKHDIEIQEVMTYNFGKLSKRYPEGFKRLAEKQNS
jgi:NTP pyrophosphatase (non-canonical NTP hydrolase)